MVVKWVGGAVAKVNPRWDEMIGTILVHLVWKDKSCGICRDGVYGPSFDGYQLAKPWHLIAVLPICGSVETGEKRGHRSKEKTVGGLLEKIHSRSETILPNMGP